MRRKLDSDEDGLSLELTRLIILIAVIGGIAAGIFARDAYRALPSVTPPSAKIGVISMDNIVCSFEYAHQMENALDDNSIKAVVIKVSSPGGFAEVCFQTEESLSKLAVKKPVVAELEEHAASGAYLIASASDHIYAHSRTITAGLGVIAVWVSYENYFEKKGISYHVWKSGEQKDWFAPWRDPTENEIAEIENLVNDYANKLFERIINNRFEKVLGDKREFEDMISDLRDGSTVTGSEAMGYGLVDNIGDYNDAVEKAATMAGLEDGEYRVVNISK